MMKSIQMFPSEWYMSGVHIMSESIGLVTPVQVHKMFQLADKEYCG